MNSLGMLQGRKFCLRISKISELCQFLAFLFYKFWRYLLAPVEHQEIGIPMHFDLHVSGMFSCVLEMAHDDDGFPIVYDNTEGI